MASNISKLALRIKENPGDSFSKFALALELLKMGDQNRSRLLFEDIMKSDPEYIGVYYHVANLYSELGENKKAFDAYKKGIEVAEQIKDQHAKSELQGALLNLELELES